MMRVPYSWLKELLPDAPEPHELARALTMGGLEVEELEEWASDDGQHHDVVLLTSVTANRGDLLSMVGVARQAAAVLGIDWNAPVFSIPETQAAVSGWPRVEVGEVVVEVVAPEACPRYSALLIDGVKVGPSPQWLRARLEAAGIRSINNVVDCTNYVVWELGQPLHAFDRDLVRDDHVIVRMAERAERIVTIDEQERVLGPEDLVIADADRAIALAGVMGGQNTEVSEGTTRLLLESAHFDATTIRKTSLRVGLSTEASYRFERHVDPNLTLPALARVAELIIETAGGIVMDQAMDVRQRQFEPREISMRVSRCNALLGTDISADDMGEYLRRLGMEVKQEDGRGGPVLRVRVPTFRADIDREVDLIEEVAIVHGYDNVPLTIHGRLHGSGRLTRRQKLERRVREVMRQCGLNENLSFSMMDLADLDRLQLSSDALERRVVRLANPMAADASVMRTTLLPALLRACALNQSRGQADVALFELNPTYLAGADGSAPEERKHLAGVIMGNPYTSPWNLNAPEPDFFWVKGIVEQLLDALGLHVQWQRAQWPPFHPGQCAQVLLAGQSIGFVGCVAPHVSEAFGIDGRVYAFELDLEPILDAARVYGEYHRLARYPAARRDIAVVAPDDDEHSAAVLEAAIRAAGGELLEAVQVFDVFTDPERFGPGRRSIAFHLTWRAPDRTLTDEEVEELMARVVGALEAKGAKLRA